MKRTKTALPALIGGDPRFPEALQPPPWPPVLEQTAGRLQEIYRSRKWSFESPAEQEFEQAFAAHHGAKHGIFMANGTVTLQCALAALGVGPGDEVIVPALTWMATAMSVHYVGATPVFVDIEPDTLCLDPVRVRDAITTSTRVIVPVHIYGSMADLDAILDIARARGLHVLEDCAHMHGGKWRCRGVGSWGDIGSFSFQQSKTLSSGEGGICLTNSDELAESIFRQKHIGYARGSKQGVADSGPPPGMICHNFRSTAFQAAILRDQLDVLEDRIERYERATTRLRHNLTDVAGVRVQARGKQASPQGYYAVVFVFDEEPLAHIPLPVLVRAIRAEGIRTGRTYGPVYRHLLYNIDPALYRIAGGSCTVAEGPGHARALLLLHQWMDSSDETLDGICDALAKLSDHAADLMAHAAGSPEITR